MKAFCSRIGRALGFFSIVLLATAINLAMAQIAGVGPAYSLSQLFTLVPATSGNLTAFHYVNSGSANQDAQSVQSGGPHQLYGYHLVNSGSTPAYVKFYNIASGTCTSSSTVAWTAVVPGNVAGAGNNFIQSQGITGFTSGICFRITANPADNDATAVTSGTVIVNVLTY